MKLALPATLVAYAAAYSQDKPASRRQAMINGAAVTGAAFLPAAAQAAVGESPRFSIFGGLLGTDATSYSEGAAYGVDQGAPLYSPYSVYSDAGENSVYQVDAAVVSKKKAVIAETKKRLGNLSSYIEQKKWFEVTTELDRYMGETRAAVRFFAESPEQKKAATKFFQAIEKTDLTARRNQQDACFAAAEASSTALDAFTALL